jgi:hypothetical protein
MPQSPVRRLCFHADLSIRHTVAAGLILWLMFVPGRLTVALQVSALDVKAAFTINFLKFVEWPSERVPSPGQPYVVAVLNDAAVERALKAAAAGQAVDGRTIVVLFIGEGEERRLASVVQQLASSHVLTVSDTPGFGRAGVMLNLFVADQRVQFEANTAAAGRAGITLRAGLLRLARIVG